MIWSHGMIWSPVTKKDKKEGSVFSPGMNDHMAKKDKKGAELSHGMNDYMQV